VTAITRAMASQRHLEIKDRHGEAQANAAMRFLRSLINFSQAEYGKALVRHDNPVSVLGEKRQWFRELPRRNVIKAHELPAWFSAVGRLANDETTQDRETVRDLLYVCLFLGLRKGEALRLRKTDVDLKGGAIAVCETKNYEARALPFGPFVAKILEHRVEANPVSPYVFGASVQLQKPISEPKRTLAKVVRESAVQFSLHDLRRSFATYLEGLDVSVYAARRLMGHKTRSDDVLGRHYVVTDVERLRPAVEKLEAFILSAAGLKPGAQVIGLAGNPYEEYGL
jgi:integrase